MEQRDGGKEDAVNGIRVREEDETSQFGEHARRADVRQQADGSYPVNPISAVTHSSLSPCFLVRNKMMTPVKNRISDSLCGQTAVRKQKDDGTATHVVQLALVKGPHADGPG